MVERFVKITLCAALLLALPASAWAEKFVKYSDVKDQIADKPKPYKPEPLAKDAITPEDLRTIQQGGGTYYLLDARGKTEFDGEHITGARLPRTEDYYKQAELFKQQVIKQAPDAKEGLQAGVADIPKDAVIITYCNKHCGLSKSLLLDLTGLGYTNVRWLDGGIDVWREKAYPLDKKS